MGSDTLQAVLDEHPVGMIWLKDGRVAWANLVARRCLQDDNGDRLNGLVEVHPSGKASLPETFVLSGQEYYLGAYSEGNSALFMFIPVECTATTFPGIERLRQSALDFGEIFRHSFDGIFVADGAGYTLMVNEGCERNYDLAASDLVGHHVSEFEKKGWIRPVVAAQVARTGQRISTTQRTHTGKTILVTGIPLFDTSGNVRKVIINSRDTTELNQLQDALAQAKEELRRVDEENEELRRQNLKVDGVVLRSEGMRRVAELAARVAKVDATVLITGQSGVGKDVVANLIHRSSNRSDGPLIKINCGALPRDLLESELFGYEPGAFTGAQRTGKSGLIELANRGTLFLDEIGDMSLDLQVKLLQVLQDRTLVKVGGTRTTPVDVRIIAATNRDLKSMVEQRTFRDDLYYRLNVVPISVPPLTERPDDIAPLVLHFMGEFNERYGCRRTVSEQAMALLLSYHWPGNVRELRNVVERLVVTSESDIIDPEFLDGILPGEVLETEPSSFRQRVARFERRLVEEAMRKVGNTRDAATLLGLSQSSVVRKLRSGE
ncbi:sigma 54-interacting transcriptional regulator [Paraburkholderia caribensis]|uniref:sigma-54 interaction domain-containing protein n=1 Tax=Paraburkholderia TaxID=1822464 RepID=UPI001CAD768B|nr:sigma 54-interacting transcriptional regulator [Paraburkholderia caribensis]BEU25577.1 sigma 54-interacting transcriptional regulator [Paraburkholderia sp. 22B1P]CAG9262622.1 Transcriptional regulatory protein TyrR [Paraburkholderia caribensis]